MTTNLKTSNDLLSQVSQLTTIEDSGRVRDAMASFKEHASATEYEVVKKALSKRLNELADQEGARLNEVDQLLCDSVTVEGKQYNLDEWLTIANYAKKYGVSTHVITNDIRRNKIPASCVLELTRINNTRMIKDQPYK